MRAPLFVSAWIVVIFACGGRTATLEVDPAGSPAPSGSPEAAPPSYDFCGEITSRRCNRVSSAECARQKLCFENIARPGLVVPLEHCVVDAACSHTDENQCVRTVATAYLSNAVFGEFIRACIGKQQLCGSIGNAYSCDTTMAIIRESILMEMQTCFAQPCGSVSRCLDGVTKPFGCGG